MFSANRQLSIHVKDLIQQNNQAGIRPNMFADQHMWMPVFFKDEFWAGMRSTQRSERMHSIFDKYLNRVVAILRDAMDSAWHKLKEHKESEHQATHVPSAINSHTRDECPVSMDELQGPRRVPTRGHPTSTRLWANLEKSSKNRARKHKNTHNHNKESNGNAQSSPTNVASSYKDTQWTCSEMTNNLATHFGSFISLLNSFHNAEQLCMCT
ncbi:hypothetical protein Ahy_A02g006690 [Arachis hypogaea]|uniref:Protein FAR1-RELATED SEQUENCE n=1 Tax=Arachis hypogaea TaxID=3818 RepID=A0A445EAI2_ARAHY|nr:hypothetical protein Ahy_A02g006690 [Arachis hypogaea]